MKFGTSIPSIMLALWVYNYLGCKVWASSLVINKCCNQSQYLSKGGLCVSKSDKSSKGPLLLDSGGLRWALPGNLFYLDPGVQYNFTEDHVEIDKFETKRPRCFGRSKSYQKLSFSQITLSPGNKILLPEFPEDDNSTLQLLVIATNDFCIDETDGGEFAIELCPPQCDLGSGNLQEGSAGLELSSPCITKCCMPHQLLGMDNFSCVDVQGDQYWNPVVSSHFNVSTSKEAGGWSHFDAIDPIRQRHIVVSKTGLPRCQMGTYDVDFRDRQRYSSVSLLSSGNLLLETIEGQRIEISGDQFCIDGILDENFNELDTSTIQGETEVHDQFAIVCFDMEPNEIDVLEEYRPVLFPLLTGISSVFLLLTSTIYIILWKDMYLPGWLQFSYTNSLLIAFGLLTIVQIWTDEIHNFGNQMCRIVGYTLHVSSLSCFFWLTSMNIDLWCSFRNTPIATGFGRSRGRGRYFGFAMFSILIPLGVTIAAVVIDDLQEYVSNAGKVVIKTEIGENSCALNIHNKMAQLYYFYGVVGLLFIANVLFFFCTVLCLRERHRETKFAHRQCTASDSDMQRLFFIMGILWIFELISWVTGFLNLNRKFQLVFLVTDCLNALQGVWIFLMFVWKRHTWKQLRKKYRKVFRLDSRTFLTGPSTVKSSVKSNTKSGSVCSKTLSPT